VVTVAMKLIGWLKNWGTLLIAVVALGVSVYTCWVDNIHYNELAKPHSQHIEINNRLSRLSERIEREEQSLSVLERNGEDISEHKEILRQAKILFNQAELAWDNGQYAEADRLIEEAYNIVPSVEVGFAWWVWLIVQVAVVVIGLLIYFLWWRKDVAQ